MSAFCSYCFCFCLSSIGMCKKVDFKKDYKDLYLPKTKPMLIDVPPMNFIMINGAGDPNH
jgi:hypothetical protein